MLSSNAPHPNWEDFLRALKLVELYDRINNGTCNQATLAELYNRSADHLVHNEPADFVRYVIYGDYMAFIGCASGKHQIGLGSFLIYSWEYKDADEFFSEMVSDRAKRADLIKIAELMCKDDAEEYL